MEWLYSLFPTETYYNITLFLSILSCDKLWTEKSEGYAERDSAESIVKIVHEEKAEGVLEYIVKFFSSLEAEESQVKEYFNSENSEHRASYVQNNCQSFLHFNSNQNIPFVYFALISLFALIFITIASIWLIPKLMKATYKKLKTNYKNLKIVYIGHKILDSDSSKPLTVNATNKTVEQKSKERENSKGTHQFIPPLVIDIPKVNTQQLKSSECYLSLENVFEETINLFFKELDQNLEMGLYLPSERGDFGTLSLTSPSTDVNILTSPLLVRRGLHQNRSSVQSLDNLGKRKMSETSSKYWSYLKKFRRQMSWVYPDTNFDFMNCERLLQADNRLKSITQFLHQRCNIKPNQWNTSTFIVDYILFLLELELTTLSHESEELLKFTRFEGTGSAANGTVVGTVDRFDVLLMLNISGCSEISVLHNNFSEDVPPGHVIIGVKDCGNSKCSRKTCIQGLSSSYLIPHQVEDLVEDLVKKAVLKLHRDHKNKTARLPFKFQMSPSQKFVLSFDTRMLQELGLDVGEITVKFIPAVSIHVPQFGILPPLCVVPIRKNDTISNQESTYASNNFLSRIVRSQNNSDLMWEICTEKLKTIIIQSIENKFLLSGIRSYHRECLMILQALFSKGSGGNLLNKGEIDESVLDTIVCFLFQESSPSSWALDNISDRISDCVHFLKSAYQNAWLPKYVIHNPHLVLKVPNLEIMFSLLSGRQHNMLAHVTNDTAMKVIQYIDQRLQETGLIRYVKPEFSSHMWEYEFFLFC